MVGVIAHAPLGLQAAGRIGIGKVRLRDGQLPTALHLLPAQLGTQVIQGDGGLFKDTGKIQRPLAGVQLGAAALLIQLKPQVQPRHPRRSHPAGRGLALQVQLRNLATGLVAGGFAAVAPAHVQLVELPGRGQAGQRRLDGSGHRKLGHQLPGQAHIGLGNVQAQMLLGPGGRVLHRPIAGRPALGRAQGRLPGKAPALRLNGPRCAGGLGLPLRRHAALHIGQGQRGPGRVAPLHAGRLQGHVGAGTHPLAIHHIRPDAGLPLALGLGNAPLLGPGNGGQLAQLQLGKPLAAPALPNRCAAGQQGAAKAPGGMQLLALVILGIQAQRMVPGAATQHQAHILQMHGGGLASLVGKLNLPPQHGQFGLL